MRHGSRKYSYNRIEFGERLAWNRRALGWSYRRLSQEVFIQTGVTIHAGTLLHAERGSRPLPEAQRRALARVLLQAAPGGHVERARDLALPEQRPEPVARWDDARSRYLALALAAAQREDWPAWADSAAEAAMLDLTMGRLDASARLLDGVLTVDTRLIGREALARVYVDRGWLAMEQARFADATRYLRRGEELLLAGEPDSVRALHFLGRVYCASGAVNDDETARERGRNYLMRALEHDTRLGNANGMGYDLLQQVSSLVYDDPRRARRYLRQSAELLGLSGTPLGHHHLSFGLLESGTAPAKAREHFELAREAYSHGLFYRKGLGSALRSLSRLQDGAKETLPHAAEYALVAALVHPYRQSLEVLEEVAMRVYFTLCDSVGQRYAAFWRNQGERVARMSEDPFTLLRGLIETPGGAVSLQTALARAERAIRQGAPEWLNLRQPLLRP